ncbi:hypothetical protein QTP88_024125 [Uroleucon formosanum]
MVRNVSPSGEALFITELLDHEDCATIPEDTTLDNAIQKGNEDVVSPVDPFCLATDKFTSGNSPSEKLEQDENTLISEDGPLADAVENAVSSASEMDMEMEVKRTEMDFRKNTVNKCHKVEERINGKLLCKNEMGHKEKCGFIQINNFEPNVPYYIIDNQKYVPLFYFKKETRNLIHRAIKIENWNLAYLKFCWKIQGIRDELFAGNSCTVTSLDNIKEHFLPETHFEDYWSHETLNSHFNIDQNFSNYANLLGVLIGVLPQAEPTEFTDDPVTAVVVVRKKWS